MSRAVKNNKNQKKIRRFVIAAVLLAVSIMASYVYFTAKKWETKIYPKVKVEDIDLTGKTKQEATKLLKDKYGDVVLSNKINIKAEKRNYTINYSDLAAKYNIDETVNEAFSYGKGQSIISKYKLISRSKGKQLNLKFAYDSKPIDETIKTMKKEIDKKPKNASLNLSGGGFSTKPGVDGAELDGEKLKKDIIEKLNSNSKGGIDVEASIKVIKPKVTETALKSVNSQIGRTFSTSYAGSSAARCNNIAVATRSINGTVVMPGETFSFNSVVGERTKAAGYQEATVIVNQKADSGLGGGICQVSTTLYNAILLSNIKTTERAHHTFPSHYVDKGLDATVDWGNIDLKFKNTFDYPIYIEGYTTGSVVAFNIYSNEKLKSTTCEMSTELYATVPAKTTYVNDSSLPAGQTEEVKSPHTGYKVKVYRSVYKNGNLIEKQLISNDYYIAINGVIKRGTGK